VNGHPHFKDDLDDDDFEGPTEFISYWDQQDEPSRIDDEYDELFGTTYAGGNMFGLGLTTNELILIVVGALFGGLLAICLCRLYPVYRKKKMDEREEEEIVFNDDDSHDTTTTASHRTRESSMNMINRSIHTMHSVIGVQSTTNTRSNSNDDIIEINVGGKIICALSSTLCLVAPNTKFSYMFSGRWKESLTRDGSGRIFIDEDSQLIEIIINFLRMKKREDPSKPIQSPKIPEEKKENFATLLDYYGLTGFFYPNSVFLPLDIDNTDIIQFHSSSFSEVKVVKSENKIQFSKTGTNFSFLACKPPLDSSGEGSFWKVTIDVLPAAVPSNNSGWINLGIIGNLDAIWDSYSDSTHYGWAGDNEVYHGGVIQNEDSDWTQFTQGECLYFHLKLNVLTMFSVQKKKQFSMDIKDDPTVDAYYIHFNTYQTGTKLTLEPLSIAERACLL